MPIKEWISGKVFNFIHGHHLVYNTCWEDPRLDKVALKLGPEDNLLVITSAGCNALSYALTGLNHVYAVDMNYRQNAVLELKIAGIKELDYETFFAIFGTGHYPDIRDVYKNKLRQHLSPSAQMFWDRKLKKYFAGRTTSYYFCGTTGYFAKKINFYVTHLIKLRPYVDKLLACNTLEDQKEIWYNQIRKRFWTRTMRFFMNRDTTLSMLGVPRAQRNQIEKTYPGGTLKFMQDFMDAIFGELPIQDNYFWCVYATGSYTKNCCPEYLEKENFQKLKNGLVDNISVYTDTVEGFLRKYDGKISRFVLLDHMDWLSESLHEALVSEWDAILEKKTENCIIIWRSGGLRTDYIQTVPVQWQGKEVELGTLLKMNPELAAELHQKDRVHTYGSFYIAELNGNRK